MPYDFKVAVDSSDPHSLADWWAGTLGWVVEPTDEAFIRKMIAEAKTVKNRLHLDIRVGADAIEAQVAELTRRGATYLHKGTQGPHWWVTMADPEGNEFCVS